VTPVWGIASEGDTPADNSVTSAKIVDGTIVNADINASAGIVKTKLAALGIVNADVDNAAAIAESKLNLASDAAAGTASRRTLGTSATSAAAGNDNRFPAGADIVNADVGGSAAIAYSKLALTGAILNADLAGSIADAKLASPNNSTYKTVFRTWGRISQSTSAGTILLPGYNSNLISGVDTGGGCNAFDLVASEYAVGGLTSKLRLKVQLHTNATAPGTMIFTAGLYPFTVAGGTNLMGYTVGTVVSGSTVVFTDPAASTDQSGNSGDFTLPSDDRYVVAVVTNATTAAASNVFITASLQTRAV
jgi:hypothetical protein